MFLNLYSGKKQKQHIDETLEELFAEYGWQQSYTAELVRLGLGFLGVGIAGYMIYLEKARPFPERRWLSGLVCLAYFIVQFAVYLWKKKVERGAFYIGHKDGETLYLTTKNPRNTDSYEVRIIRDTKEFKTVYKFEQLVDTHGVVHREKLDKVTSYIQEKV